MRRRIALAVTLLVALSVAPGAGSASHGTVGLTTIAGHITDVLGEPVRACVTAYHQAQRVSAISSAADGSYSLTVLPGRHTVAVTDVVELNGPRCPFDGWSSSYRYEHQTRIVSTTGQNGPEDFALRYRLAGGVWGDVCCLESAGKPGAQVQLYAQVALDAAPHIQVVWTDHESGESVAVPRWPDFWQETYGMAGFEGYYTIPSDRPDGVYRSTFASVHAGGLEVTNSFSVDTVVDSTAPAIIETFPGDGQTVATRFRPWVRATDELAGVADFRTRMRLRDLTTGTDLPTVWSFDGGPKIRSYRDLVLEPNHAYEATWSVRDNADNVTERTVTFTTGPGGEWGAHGPTGYITDPYAPIEAYVGGDLDPATLLFRVVNLSTGGGTLVDTKPHYDPATGRAWLQPRDLPLEEGDIPRLLPGEYRVDATALHRGLGGSRKLSWTFVVHPF